MIERKPEVPTEALVLADETGDDALFEEQMKLVHSEVAQTQIRADLERRVREGSLTTKEYDAIDEQAYFVKRDAEIELKRAQRRAKRHGWLARLGFQNR